jgi:hypothetical protein
MTDPRPAQPHGALQEVFPNIFVVRGSFRFMPLFSIARNMTILRQGDELIIFNSVRLDEEGQKQLDALGKVKHLVKLGFFHGYDDPYYLERYKPTYWAPRPKDQATPLAAGPVPFTEGDLFLFEKGNAGEAAIILPREGGNVLVTCDSVQNWVDIKGCSAIGGVFMRTFGFIEPAKIGPFWMKKITDNNPSIMKPDFDRLLEKDFDRLISAHGDVMTSGLKAALRRSVEKTFSTAAR